MRRRLYDPTAELLHLARLAHINARGVEPEHGLELFRAALVQVRRDLKKIDRAAAKRA